MVSFSDFDVVLECLQFSYNTYAIGILRLLLKSVSYTGVFTHAWIIFNKETQLGSIDKYVATQILCL